MPPSPPRVLLIDPVVDLRDLNALVLRDGGYSVEIPPTDANPVDFAAKSQPNVIVLGIRYKHAEDWQILDQLQQNPSTQGIPVVAISTSVQQAGEARASPVTSYSLIAPYDIDTLLSAVAKALKRPPPAATLPRPTRAVTPAVAFATDELNQHARDIVIAVVRNILESEPYKSRFSELTPGLVDNLAIMFAAINQGLKRSLSPKEVFTTPIIQQAIQEHVQLRQSQQLNTAETIREYQDLVPAISTFLQGLIGKHGFTGRDALQITLRVQQYVAELVREVTR